MKIIERLGDLEVRVNAIREPLLSEIDNNSNKIQELQVKAAVLINEINDINTRPIIKKGKQKELKVIQEEINLLNEDNSFLNDKLKFNEELNALEDEFSELRCELTAEKQKKRDLEIQIREKYNKKIQDEVTKLWNEPEYKEALQNYSSIAFKLNYDLMMSQI